MSLKSRQKSFSLVLLTIELKFARATFFENKLPYGLSLSLPLLPFSGTKERWKSHLSPHHCMQIRVGDNSQGPTDRASRASRIASKKEEKVEEMGRRKVPQRSPASFSFHVSSFRGNLLFYTASYCTRHDSSARSLIRKCVRHCEFSMRTKRRLALRKFA